jgi:hypothetical protein
MFYFDRTWWTYKCFTSSVPDEHTNVLLGAYLMNITMFYFEHTWWTYQCFNMFIRYARSKTLVCSSAMLEVKQWYVHQVCSKKTLVCSSGTLEVKHYHCFTSSIADEHTNVLLRAYLMNISMFCFERTWWAYQCFTSIIPDEHINVLLRSLGSTLEVKHWYVHQVCSK